MAAGSWKMVVSVLLLLPLLPLASSSSMVFKLAGNVYPTGRFYVTMNIGVPAKLYFLDIDTGSNLTWLECHANNGPCKTCNKVPHPLYRPTPNKLVRCADPLCDAQHRDLGTPKDCAATPHQCSYEIRYLDGSSSLGVLLLDKFSLPTGSALNIAFGCGYDQMGGPKKAYEPVPVDGILGLGRGSVDLVSQLKHSGAVSKNVIGHCLGSKGGGYLFIGEEHVPSSHVTWVPMAPRTPGEDNHYYSPGHATLHLDRKSIGTKPVKAIFDSGSTYTYLPENLHVQLVSSMKASLSKSLKDVSDAGLPLCWKGPKPFKTMGDLKKEFKPLVSLKFDHGIIMTIPPENYLIITGHGNACFGILGLRADLFVIGAIAMQEQLVVYDNEKGRLAWMPSPCDKMPKSKAAIVSCI